MAEPVGTGPLFAAHPAIPHDPEIIGCTRRQFFNRATVSLMSVSLAGFAAAAFVAFLWPSGTGGFGGQITVGKIGNIKDGIKQGGGFFYAAEARSWITSTPPRRSRSPRPSILRASSSPSARAS